MDVGTTHASVFGVFAAATCDKIYRQCGDGRWHGVHVALDAEKYLAAQEYEALAAE